MKSLTYERESNRLIIASTVNTNRIAQHGTIE